MSNQEEVRAKTKKQKVLWLGGLAKNFSIKYIKKLVIRTYTNVMGSLRFLSINRQDDSHFYHDLLCFLAGKPSIEEIQIHENKAHFRDFYFLFSKSSTQLVEIVNEIFVSRIYEGFGARIKQGDTVLDCGANIGLFTLYAKERVGPTGKIICIEPMPETYELLVYNVRIKSLNEPRAIVPLNLALSEKKETRLFMYSTERNASATGCTERFDVVRKARDAYKIKVLCTTLDEIVLNKLKIRVDFIKMDIEGMETEAIRGGSEIIRLFKPKFVISPHFGSKEPIKMLKEIRPDYKIVRCNNIIYAW